MKNLTACSVVPVSIDSLAEMLVHLLAPIAEDEYFPEDGFFIFEGEDGNPLEDVFDVNGSANYPRILFCSMMSSTTLSIGCLVSFRWMKRNHPHKLF